MKIHNHEKCHSDHAEKQHSFFNSIKKEWKNYKPLIIIVVFCFILPVTQDDLGNQHYMYSFMGYFFIFFSLFKFFNLKGFIDGFSTYDLVTKRFRVYGYAYPFIEFLLGVAYLSKLGLFFINWITVIVMTVSGIGVLKSILFGQKNQCACLGTVLNVPLGVISVLENFGMGAMALLMILFAIH